VPVWFGLRVGVGPWVRTGVTGKCVTGSSVEEVRVEAEVP